MTVSSLSTFLAAIRPGEMAADLSHLYPQAQVYCSQDTSACFMNMGLNGRGPESLYFAGTGNGRFYELMETGISTRGTTRLVSLEALGVGPLQFELEDGTGALYDAGGALIAGALGRIDPKDGLAIIQEADLRLKQAKKKARTIGSASSPFVLMDKPTLREKACQGDPNAIMALFNRPSYRWSGIDISKFPDIPEAMLGELGKMAMHDDRSYFAICALATVYNCIALSFLRNETDHRRLALGAQFYQAPLDRLWGLAKEGDAVALATIHGLALVHGGEAVQSLLNLFSVWKVPGAGAALQTLPIEGRGFIPTSLKIFADAGHPDATRLLRDEPVASYVAGAAKNNCATIVLQCPEVRDLVVLADSGNSGAVTGLLELFAAGHMPAREAVRQFQKSGHPGFGPEVIARIDLSSLAARAATEPRVVIALYNFFTEHDRFEASVILKNLPVGHLLELAATHYDAIGAIYFLDQIGNGKIREGIHEVNIEQWRRDYNCGGHAKREGFEARDAMRILAELGHEEACRHERIAIPKRAARALATLEVVAAMQDTDVPELLAKKPTFH